LVAELGKDVARGRLGAEDLDAVAVLVVVAAGAVAHHEPVEALVAAVAGGAAGDAAAVAAPGQAEAGADVLAVFQQVERADRLVADGAGRGGEARIGGGRAGLDL